MNGQSTPVPLKIVVFGLSLSSSWGNGHATTYRALLTALAARGHDILFLERDAPWYSEHRDLRDPAFCRLAFYTSISDIEAFSEEIGLADLVIIGSYVPDAITLSETIRPVARTLAFYDIDTPVTLARLADGGADYISTVTIPLYDMYLSFTAGPALLVLEERYHARRARALFCGVDPVLYRPSEQSARPRWVMGYLGTYSADRQPALERLLLEPARRQPSLRFVVAGSQYPSDQHWPENVDRIEHLPPASHAEFYNDVAWTLNLTRADMIATGYSPSVRLFEAGACGTAIISDVWAGLDSIFTIGSEIMIATCADDVLTILAMPEAARQAVGQAGRRRVLQEHTAEFRARLLESYVAEIAS